MMLASPASTEDFTEPSPRHRKQRSPASWSDGSDASSEQCPRNESPKSPLDLHRYEVSVETSAEEDTDDGDSPKLGRRLSRKEVEDIEWLKSSTRREMSLLELAFHGTVDLESDVPEMREDMDFTCERFLQGSQHNRKTSFRRLSGYMLWRSNTTTVRDADILESLKARKVFVLRGPNRSGGPIVVIFAKNHDMFKTPVEETVKLLTYSLDKAIGQMDRSKGVTEGNVVLDWEGVGWRSLDVEALKHIMLFFQNYYPERVTTAIFWKAPKVFFTLWTMVKPFLSESTRAKVAFASGREDLERIVCAKNLPEHFGGQASNDSMIPIDEL